MKMDKDVTVEMLIAESRRFMKLNDAQQDQLATLVARAVADDGDEHNDFVPQLANKLIAALLKDRPFLENVNDEVLTRLLAACAEESRKRQESAPEDETSDKKERGN
jgi:hypothetical protein